MRQRLAFTLVELLVVIAVIGILVSIMLPAINAVRESARRSSCANNMRQVGLAMLTYHNAAEKFPMGIYGRNFGTRWRYNSGWVSLLPYVEEKQAFEAYNFEKYADQAENSTVTSSIVSVFTCPSDDSRGRVLHFEQNDTIQGRYSRSNFAFCFGDDTFYIEDSSGDTSGAFRFDRNRRISDLVDGASKTVLAGEVLAGKDDNYKHPDREMDIRGAWGFFVMGSSCYTHKLSPNGSEPDLLESQFCSETLNMPCETVPFAERQTLYAAARSAHPGGVHVVFADNRVEFVSDEIREDVWQAIATIEGEESVGMGDL